MPLFWFLAGVLSTVAALALAWPWLKAPVLAATFTATPLRAGASAAALVAAIFALHALLGHPQNEAPTLPSPAADVGAGGGATSFGAAAKVFGIATGANSPMGAAATPGGSSGAASAGSMDSAVANLEARLANSGGSPGDWELLAKSFEFLNRPEDAAKARAHQLPVSNQIGEPSGQASAQPGSAAVTVSGEVSLAAALRAKVASGDTLFIIAKSADSPGVPVAVVRGSVDTWPLRFTLDDSQAMMPGRTLSSVGRVTVEARLSKTGPPLPSSGDLQGSSGVLDPAGHKPLRITIDHVIP